MPRDLQSLETELGMFESEMDDEAAKVFDKIDAVRARAPEIFKRTHARLDEKAKSVDRVDALLSSLDRSNSRPTLPASLNGSGNSSAATAEPAAAPAAVPVDSAEKKS
jgi:hypothetical protein